MNHIDAVRIEYPNGYWIQVATDPGVLEVQTKPSTIEQLEQIESKIQIDLFDAASKIGLKPAKAKGAGQY